ncbi:hypothetical protein ElyMa_000474400 [Elysia marginata]|uniref:Uncharacterized protein n=1 Tax=Elysia marginata TaxID=1093978 RepID=A0AAV4FRW0_9GAST|nr:hypothetical protein ElyMa_000474400 [Elysia marginata]
MNYLWIHTRWVSCWKFKGNRLQKESFTSAFTIAINVKSGKSIASLGEVSSVGNEVKKKASESGCRIEGTLNTTFHNTDDSSSAAVQPWARRQASASSADLRYSTEYQVKAYNCPEDIAASRLLPASVPTLTNCPNPSSSVTPKRPPFKKRNVSLSSTFITSSADLETHEAHSEETEDCVPTSSDSSEHKSNSLVDHHEDIEQLKDKIKFYQQARIVCRGK